MCITKKEKPKWNVIINPNIKRMNKRGFTSGSE